jgi:hypothetical protein
VALRFEVAGVEEYLSLIADTAGPIGLARRGLTDAERERVGAEAQDALARFATARGYELPGLVLCAVAQ